MGWVGSRSWRESGEPTSRRLWAWVARETLCNEAQFTTKEVDILTSPDCVSWIWRIAVQLLDVVSDGGAYFVGKSKIVERRSARIKVFCDRDLPDELTVPDVQEEKRRGCRELFWSAREGIKREWGTRVPILPPWRSGS